MHPKNYRPKPLFAQLKTEVHVYLGPDSVSPPLRPAAEQMLDVQEKGRYGRFRFEKDRQRFLAAHRLLRKTLSAYIDCAPQDWVFFVRPGGRPEIRLPVGTPPLRFSISRTRGMVACLVALGDDVGVDVEHVRVFDDMVQVAERFFHPLERRRLRTLPPRLYVNAFYEIWTLKEAFLKAEASGLMGGLDSVCFVKQAAGGYAIASSDGRAGQWQLFSERPTAHHCLAVAIRRPLTARMRVVYRKMHETVDRPD